MTMESPGKTLFMIENVLKNKSPENFDLFIK